MPFSSPFKKKQTQSTVILRENRNIDIKQLPIETLYIQEPDSVAAWHLVHKLLLPLQGSKDMALLVSERDCIPLDPFNLLTPEERDQLNKLNPIALAALHRQIARIEKDSNKNIQAQLARFVVLSACIMFCVTILLAMLGKITLPFFTGA